MESRLFSNTLLFSMIIVFFIGTSVLYVFSTRDMQSLARLSIGKTRLRVEMAITPQQIEKGLSGRKEVTGNGMLFVLPQRGTPNFWMKDMLFALDFVWINNDIVVDLTENVLPPKASSQGGKNPDSPQVEQQLPTYAPHAIVSHVLEVPAGFVKAHSIRIGDEVQWR